jgi:hypothetical protein
MTRVFPINQLKLAFEVRNDIKNDEIKSSTELKT